MSSTTYSPDQYLQSTRKQLRPTLVTHSASRIARMLADAAVPVSVLAVVFLMHTSGVLSSPLEPLEMDLKLKSVIFLVLTVLSWWGIFRAFGLYDYEKIVSHWYEARSVALASSLCCGVYFVLWPDAIVSSRRPNFIVLSWLLTVTAALTVRFLLKVYEAEISPRLASKRSILIVGTGRFALQLYEAVLGQRNWRVVGFVRCNDEPCPDWASGMLLGPLADLEKLLMLGAIDEVSVALPVSSDYQRIQEVIAVCEKVGVDVRHFSNSFEYRLARPKCDGTSDVSGILLKTVHYDSYCQLVKRAIDIVAATFGLVLLSPLFILTALGIALTSPGPVLFEQERYGLQKRRFTMLKFRTMCADAENLQLDLEHMNEASGPIFKIKNDPRITPLGKFLRKSSIDELPQLYNVLCGEMSLVGPRPMSVRDVSRFSEAWLMRRFSVKPGITGLWQISGRSNTSFDHWVQMDLQYIDCWSLGLDLEILLKTVPAVLRGTGAV